MYICVFIVGPKRGFVVGVSVYQQNHEGFGGRIAVKNIWNRDSMMFCLQIGSIEHLDLFFSWKTIDTINSKTIPNLYPVWYV